MDVFVSVIQNFFLLYGIIMPEVILMNRTAVIVRAIRRQMGWTRKEMACAIGVSAACIERVERGEQKLEEDAAERLCALTGAELSRIM